MNKLKLFLSLFMLHLFRPDHYLIFVFSKEITKANFNYLWGDSIYLYSILHLCLCFGTEESKVYFFIIISAPPEMKAGLSKKRKFVKIQKNYFFVPQWLLRSLRVLLWIWMSVFLKKRPFEYLPWYIRKRTIFGAALKGENLSCCCYINVGGFKCIYI